MAVGRALRQVRAIHRSLGQLVLRLAGQQVDEAALDALALEQGALDLAGRSASRRPGARPGRAPPGRCRRLRLCPGQGGLHLGPCATLGQLHPEAVVARQFEPQVAMRSPIPGQARRRSAGWLPATIPEPGHLGKTPGQEPGLAVVTEAELAVSSSCGDASPRSHCTMTVSSRPVRSPTSLTDQPSASRRAFKLPISLSLHDMVAAKTLPCAPFGARGQALGVCWLVRRAAGQPVKNWLLC